MFSRIYAFVSFLPEEDEIEKDHHFKYALRIHFLNLFHSVSFVVLGWFLRSMSAKTYLIFK